MLRPEEGELLAGADGALLAVDDRDRIVHATPAALALLGWDGRLVGRELTAIIPPYLRQRHLEGFRRYVRTGESRLMGRTVRVPARRQDGSEVLLDLTIRVFRRPDGSRLAVGALSETALGRPPPGLVALQDAFSERLYELV